MPDEWLGARGARQGLLGNKSKIPQAIDGKDLDVED
jgi:hypothetical protein